MPQHEPKMQHVHLFVICICRSQVWRKSILYSVGNFLGLGRVNQFADFPTGSVVKGFPCGSLGKESTCNAGDLGTIPGLGISPTEGKGYPLQYSKKGNTLIRSSCCEEGSWCKKTKQVKRDLGLMGNDRAVVTIAGSGWLLTACSPHQVQVLK